MKSCDHVILHTFAKLWYTVACQDIVFWPLTSDQNVHNVNSCSGSLSEHIYLNPSPYECVLVSTWGSAARPVPQEEPRTDRSGTDPDSEGPPNPVNTPKQALSLANHCSYSTARHNTVQHSTLFPELILVLLASFTAAKEHHSTG